MYTEPQQNVFNFKGGDTVVDLARATNKTLRCHTLVWSNQLPNWITTGKWTNATLTAALKTHIETLVKHWEASCWSWDVVNEALNQDGSFASNVFYDTIGAAYIPLAFAFASAAVKRSGRPIKLFYNDHSIEFPGPKNDAAARLVRDLQRRGIAIDGVGFESHFLVGQTPSLQGQIQATRVFTDLGLVVQRSELDVRFTSLPPSASGANSYAQQARDYYDTVAACMAVTGCTGYAS